MSTLSALNCRTKALICPSSMCIKEYDFLIQFWNCFSFLNNLVFQSLDFDVPDEWQFINAPCALNLISTFLAVWYFFVIFFCYLLFSYTIYSDYLFLHVEKMRWFVSLKNNRSESFVKIKSWYTFQIIYLKFIHEYIPFSRSRKTKPFVSKYLIYKNTIFFWLLLRSIIWNFIF